MDRREDGKGSWCGAGALVKPAPANLAVEVDLGGEVEGTLVERAVVVLEPDCNMASRVRPGSLDWLPCSALLLDVAHGCGC